MTRPATSVVTSVCILVACVHSGVGCGRAKSPPLPALQGKPGGNGGMTVEGTTANYQEWDGGVAVVIWTDIETGRTPGNSRTGGSEGVGSTGKVRITGKNLAADGRAVEWQGETGDGRTGTIRINGVEYDLAEGPLFLVSTRGPKAGVRQLMRDLSGPKQGGDGLRRLAAEDEEVKRFVSDASKKE